MTYIVKGDNINHLVYNTMDLLSNNGNVSSNRNQGSLGNTTYMNNVVLELSNPRSRHLNLVGRKNNLAAVIAETFWVMSGSNRVNPFLSYFLPRAKEFSDDGETWHGAYGDRIFKHGQVQSVIDIFKEEGLNTRRAVIDIYQSAVDSKFALNTMLGIDKPKDVPCNNLIHFYVNDGKLNCNVFQRSGDLIWGTGNINIPEFTFLQEYIAQEIGVELGSYAHWVTNLHVYDKTSQQMMDVLDNSDSQDFESTNDTPLIFPNSKDIPIQIFFEGLVNLYSMMIIAENINSYENSLLNIVDYFDQYNVPKEGNLLFSHMTTAPLYRLLLLEIWVQCLIQHR